MTREYNVDTRLYLSLKLFEMNNAVPDGHFSALQIQADSSSEPRTMINLLTLLGTLAIAGNGIGYFTVPGAVRLGIGQLLNLKENGMVFPQYVKPPFAGKSEFYIYAIKNPKDVLNGSPLKFELKGPYVYSYNLHRDNIVFTKSGEAVRFDSHRTMFLDEQSSNDLDEKMWFINPIILSTMSTVRSMVIDRIPFQRVSEPIVFNAVNVLLDTFKERLFVRGTPRLLLEGRKVELLESLSNLAERFGLKSLLPPGPPENTFGLAHAQNATVDNMEIYAGLGSTKDKYAEVRRWRGRDRMVIWSGQCNVINGTNGELYKPFLVQGKRIKIFLKDFCRTFHLDPVSDIVTVQNGLKALEYELTKTLYQGVRNNPQNKCYCKDPRTYDCQYDGLIRMGPCFFDAPLFFAMGNFKGMDRRIRSTIGQDESEISLPDRQSFYLDPITGTVLKVNLTLVGTFKMVRQPYMRDLAKVRNLTYAPLFATHESIELPSSMTNPLKALQLLLEYHRPLNVAGIFMGFGLLLIGVVRNRRLKKPNNQISPTNTS